MNTRKYTFDYNNSAGKLKYFLNYANRKTDGYEAALNQNTASTKGNFGSDSEQYSLKLIYDFSDNQRLTV